MNVFMYGIYGIFIFTVDSGYVCDVNNRGGLLGVDNKDGEISNTIVTVTVQYSNSNTIVCYCMMCMNVMCVSSWCKKYLFFLSTYNFYSTLFCLTVDFVFTIL